MATATTNPSNSILAQRQEMGVEDTFPVQSRISWGAIFAGAVVALSVYFVLMLLGAALGLTTAAVTDTPYTQRGYAYYATAGLIWGTISMLAGLFCGGCVAGQLSVGETRNEAIIYGVIVWGTVVAMQMVMTASGARAASSAVMSAVEASGPIVVRSDNWESVMRGLGYEQEQIDKFRDRPEDAIREARAKLNDPETRQAVLRGATATAWFALIATLAMLGASIGGAVYGAGPEMRLLARVTRVTAMGVVRT